MQFSVDLKASSVEGENPVTWGSTTTKNAMKTLIAAMRVSNLCQATIIRATPSLPSLWSCPINSLHQQDSRGARNSSSGLRSAKQPECLLSFMDNFDLLGKTSASETVWGCLWKRTFASLFSESSSEMASWYMAVQINVCTILENPGNENTPVFWKILHFLRVPFLCCNSSTTQVKYYERSHTKAEKRLADDGYPHEVCHLKDIVRAHKYIKETAVGHYVTIIAILAKLREQPVMICISCHPNQKECNSKPLQVRKRCCNAGGQQLWIQ